MPVVVSRRLEVPEWPLTKQTPRVAPTPTSPVRSMTLPMTFKKSRRPVNTALHQAVLDERIKQVKLLVLKHGADVNSVDVFGRTPLMLACTINNQDIASKMINLFLDNGATFNNRDMMGRTVLSYACMKGKVVIVERILDEDIFEINEPDNDGCTPLHHSAVQGNTEIIRLLVDKVLEFSLDIDRKDKLGYTALLLACKHGWYRSALILLEEGYASPCTRDNEYFYNAVQWLQASRPPCVDPQAQYLSQRSKTCVTAFENSAKSFDRSSGKSSIYRRHRMPTGCKHGHKEPDPLSSTDIDLPLITRSNSEAILAKELRIKEELLCRIEELFPSEKQRPSTAATGVPKPSTAKLLSLRPDGGNLHSGSGNIGHLLSIYANHYTQLKGGHSRSRPVTVSLGEKAFRR